jgi:hypothetical protein
MDGGKAQKQKSNIDCMEIYDNYDHLKYRFWEWMNEFYVLFFDLLSGLKFSDGYAVNAVHIGEY